MHYSFGKSLFNLLALLLIANIAVSQKYYETEYPHLQDAIYYPQIDAFISKGNMDGLINLSEDAFNYYYNKRDVDKALYLFNLCMYFPSGYGLAEKCVPLIKEKEEFLRKHTDTLNIHYGTLVFIHATANIRLFNLKPTRSIFANAISILEQSDAPELHLYEAIKSAAFLHVYLYENKTGYNLANKALNGLLHMDTAQLTNKKKSSVVHDIAYSYMTLAALMKQTKQIELSLAYNLKAHETFTSLGYARENMAVTITNVSDNYLELNKPKEALRSAMIADNIMTANSFLEKMKTTYNAVLANKGKAYMELEHYSKADSTFRLLLQFMNKKFRDREPVKADTYTLIAANFSKQNQMDSAISYYQKALEFHYDPHILSSIAETTAKIGYYKSAAEFAKKNLTTYLKVDNFDFNKGIPKANDFNEFYNGGKTCYKIANYLLSNYLENKAEYDLMQAMAYINLSDSLMEQYRDATLIGGDDLYAAKLYHDIAKTGIKTCIEVMQSNNDSKYLETIFSFIAQSTAFKLNAEVNQSLYATNNSLRTEQLTLLQTIRKVENEMLALDENSQKSTKQLLSERLFNLRKEAFQLTFEMQNNETENMNGNTSPNININAVQNKLEQNEALVAYFDAGENIYSLFITKSNVEIFETATGEPFLKTLKSFYKSIKTGSNEIRQTGKVLHKYLIEPFEHKLNDIEKLTIIPDGILNQIPFEAITTEKEEKYLIENFAITYNYSIFLWLNSQTSKNNYEDLSFVGFAPVFADNQKIDSLNILSYDDELRSGYPEIKSGNKLKPLKYSGDEVKGIQDLFQKKGKLSKIFMHSNANEKNLKANLKGYSIVHIATHGFASNKEPKLSGLFVSKDKDNKELTNDGFIYLNEISTLNSDAQLVVLSACKTGTGKISTGEGVLALPRAFIFAGVPNLIASLWKIHDKKTKSLMIDFYSQVLEGKTFADALRNAKLKQIAKGEQPIDWSGIVLIGE